MAAPAGTTMKELFRLIGNVDKLTDGQAIVYLEDSDNENDGLQSDHDVGLITFYFDIKPKDGYYKGGRVKFKVEVEESYPANAPVVTCCNVIYHPNIDLTEENEFGSVCVNLLSSDWTPEVGLDGCVMAILFLFYNPELEDPLSPLFSGDETTSLKEFTENVKISMRGGEIDGYTFDRITKVEEETEVDSVYDLNKNEEEMKVNKIENDPELNKAETKKEGDDMLDLGTSFGDNETEKEIEATEENPHIAVAISDTSTCVLVAENELDKIPDKDTSHLAENQADIAAKDDEITIEYHSNNQTRLTIYCNNMETRMVSQDVSIENKKMDKTYSIITRCIKKRFDIFSVFSRWLCKIRTLSSKAKR